MYSATLSLIPSLYQEIKVLSQLKHPNIVQYYGSEIVSNVCFYVLASSLMFFHWTMPETKHKILKRDRMCHKSTTDHSPSVKETPVDFNHDPPCISPATVKLWASDTVSITWYPAQVTLLLVPAPGPLFAYSP